MKILFIHPEGNIHNNPNLLGIVGIMKDAGYAVEVMCPRRPEIYQGPIGADIKLTLIDIPWRQGPFILANMNPAEANDIPATVNKRVGDYDFVFGVDRGIVEAALIAKVKRVPCALISYEIFFLDEAGAEFKQWEINACKHVSLAICQDPVRSGLLSRENRIAPELIFNVPVVGRGYRTPQDRGYLRERFALDQNARIALYVGSLDTWTMSEYLAESAMHWSNNWYLVLHNRYLREHYAAMLYEKYSGHPRILFSREPFDRQADMQRFIGSADVGMAFYKATHASMYTGKNIEFVGMSSGKANTYLQHGVPVITNEQGVLGRFLSENSIGLVVDTDRHFNPGDQEEKLDDFRKNVPESYQRHLDLERLMQPVMARIAELTSGRA